MIQGTYTLVDLPNSLTGPGEILGADVYVVAGATKKKRSELALAVDKESVNLYDVWSSKLITSYAVSPLALFTCPPCSVRYRRHRLDVARRFTYCSVTSPKAKLLCFSESSGRGFSPGSQISTSKFDIRQPSSPIVLLEVLPGNGSSATTLNNRLLTVHRDGEVRCYSENLQTEEWASGSSAQGDVDQDMRVELAAVVTFEQAQKSLLKDREDLVAMLSGDVDTATTSLLLLITRSLNTERSLKFRLFGIKPLKQDLAESAVRSARIPIQELCSLTIPERGDSETGMIKFTLHAASGTLYQYTPGALLIYDLTGSVPLLAHDMKLARQDASTCLRLSPSLVMLNTGACMSIVDVQFSSLQAECPLDNSTTAAPSLRLLSYFAPLDLVVALQGRKLVGIQLSISDVQGVGSRKRKRDGLLINSVGRGIESMNQRIPQNKALHGIPKSLGALLPFTFSDSSWNDQRESLDHYLARDDGEQFEKLMASELSVPNTQRSNDAAKSVTNAVDGGVPDLRKVYYLLGKMFTLEYSADSMRRRLRLHVFPASIVSWLFRKGLFSVHLIETSLRKNGTLPLTDRIATGALIQALAEWDVSLDSLLSLLKSYVPLEAKELAHALGIFMELTKRNEDFDQMRLLTNGELRDEIEPQGSESNANPDPPDAESKNSGTTPEILQATLIRLNAYPSSTITRALKTELSSPDLLTLVDVFRMELARNGWLSPYTESSPTIATSNNANHDNHQISIIAKLLNCVINAIGTTGWILGSSSMDLTEPADTIAYMKAEISAALEGVEEAIYLQGMLGEVLLYGKSSNQVVTQRANPAIAIASVDLVDKRLIAALPLGLKAASTGVGTTKVGAGGELIQRSQRDIGRLKSRTVGKYSFERIII